MTVICTRSPLAADLGDDASRAGAGRVGLDRGIDGFACVLDEIGDGLGEQPPIRQRHHRLVGKVELEGDLGPAHLEQEHGFAHDLAHVVTLHHRLRHAGEGGELVDHAADIRHLADDGVGALVEHLAILGDGVAVFAADAFG